MDINEIVKSINDLETQLKTKDDQIQKLTKSLDLEKSDHENTEQCLTEVEARLKQTLTTILKTVKQGMSVPKKERLDLPTKDGLLND